MSHSFSVIGLNHGHINGQVRGLLATGDWSLKQVFAEEADLLEQFKSNYPDVDVAESADQVIEGARVFSTSRSPLTVTTQLRSMGSEPVALM